MKAIAKDLEENISEFLDTRIILKDIDGLGRFVTHVEKFLDSERKRAEAKMKQEKAILTSGNIL